MSRSPPTLPPGTDCEAAVAREVIGMGTACQGSYRSGDGSRVS